MCLRHELWRAADEPGELWSIEYQLMEEDCTEVMEKRSIDPGHKVFQIFTNPCKPKHSQNGEESACRRRWLSVIPVRATSRGFESQDETLEPGQHGETSDHRLG